MSKKGGGSQTVKQELDPTIKPYVEFALQQGKNQYQQRANNYQPYNGQLVAGFNNDSQNYFSGVRGLNAGDATLAQAKNNLGNASGSIANRAEYQAGNFDPGTIGSGQIDQFMNPYTDSVINKQMEMLQRKGQEDQARLRAQQAAARGLGGSRAAVESSLQQRDYDDRMANSLLDMRQSGWQQALAAAQAQQQREMEGRAQGESSRQFAESSALERANYGLQSAQALAGMSDTERAREMQRLAELRNIGAVQQAQEQSLLDTLYKQYLEKRDWSKNELADFAAIAYGAPHGMNQTTGQPKTSPWSVVGGLGMYGLGSLFDPAKSTSGTSGSGTGG